MFDWVQNISLDFIKKVFWPFKEIKSPRRIAAASFLRRVQLVLLQFQSSFLAINACIEQTVAVKKIVSI